MTTSIIRNVVRLLVPVLVAAGAILLWRGHDAPGGGFIGALVAAVALALVELTQRPSDPPRRVPGAATLLGAGLLISVLTGTIPLLVGDAFLEGAKLALHLPLVGELELASSLAFDVGVALIVVGVLRSVLDALGETTGETTS